MTHLKVASAKKEIVAVKTTTMCSNQLEGRAIGLRRVFCFNNIDVASLIQALSDPLVILVRMSVSLNKLSLLNPNQVLFLRQISADSSPRLIILLSCSYQMKAMLPRATISGTHGLTCSRASNLRAPATGTSQRAPTTLFCFLR